MPKDSKEKAIADAQRAQLAYERDIDAAGHGLLLSCERGPGVPLIAQSASEWRHPFGARFGVRLIGFMPVPETHEGDHPEPSTRNYLLKADGSGTGTIENPAQGAIGVVLRDPDGGLVEEISRPIGPAINTVAEYRALLAGLDLARGYKVQRIRVFLDSELVVDQVNGCAKVGKEHIRPWHAEACSLLQEFPNIRISWIPRKWNAEADALATKAPPGR